MHDKNNISRAAVFLPWESTKAQKLGTFQGSAGHFASSQENLAKGAFASCHYLSGVLEKTRLA